MSKCQWAAVLVVLPSLALAQPAYEVKRIVVGADASGRSAVLFNDHPKPTLVPKAGNLKITELWSTDTAPADNSGREDRARPFGKIEPDGPGTVFRVIEYPPDSVRLKSLDTQHFQESGATAADVRTRRHAGMHRTNTVDYAIVLQGECYAVLDEGEVLVKAGDMIVMRGVDHGWSNRTERPCVLAFVLVAAKPVH